MGYWIPIPGMIKGIRVEMVPVKKKKKKKKRKGNKNDNCVSRRLGLERKGSEGR